MGKMSILLGVWEDIADGITGLIGGLLYDTIGHIIIMLLDWLQSIFRGLAGLEGMKINGVAVNGEGQESYDLAYWLISTDIIMDIFWSMIWFSAFLLIIMTVLALVKNTYEEKQKPVWDIISQSFKGLLGFILVPAMVIVGLMFSNVILVAIDAGTSFGNSSKMSTSLFMSSAYDSNWIRYYINDDITETKKLEKCQDTFETIVEKTNFEEYSGVAEYYGRIESLTLDDYEVIATLLDDAFTGESLKNNLGYVLTAQTSWSVTIVYNLFKVNYIILLAGGCVLIGIFFKMCWGMVGRMFKVCFDFVLIPVACAMTPFDGGKANKAIQGDMVKNVTMAYGTVGALNLYFSILPIVNTIEFNNGGIQSWGVMTAIFQLMISIVGVFSCQNIIKSVNGWFGTGDVLAEGDSTLKAFQSGMKSIKSGFGAKDQIKKGKKNLANKWGAYLGGVKQARADGKKGLGVGLAGVGSAFRETKMYKDMKENNFARNVAAGKKAAKDSYKDVQESKGLWEDAWSTDTEHNDAAKGAFELKQAGIALEKKYQPYENKLKKLEGEIKADPNNYEKQEEYKNLKKRLDKMKANDPVVQQLQKGGQAMQLFDEAGNSIGTKSMQDWDDEVAESEEKLGKAEKSQQSVSSFAGAYASYETAMKEVGSVDGYNYNNFMAFVKGQITDPNLVAPGMTSEQKESLNEARTEYRTMMNESLDSLVEIYKSNPNAVDGKTVDGKEINEGYIRSITDPAVATKLLIKMKDWITDYNKIAADMMAANTVEKKRIKSLKENITTTKSNISDDARANPNLYGETYGKGGKS